MLQSVGSQRVGHDLVTEQQQDIYVCVCVCMYVCVCVYIYTQTEIYIYICVPTKFIYKNWWWDPIDF